MNTHNKASVARWPHNSLFVRPIPSLLEDLFSARTAGDGRSSSSPLINVWSDAQAVHVESELPGLAIEDIELTVLGDELTLKGENENNKGESKATSNENVTMHHQEWRSGRFERRIRLPFEVQSEAVTAELMQGVLHVTLPKSEAVKPRRIPVRSAGQ
ncbi:MAG: Hsp20/alpha crystallin family protein [Planctomycetota bacterium]|jgi:HSP20 family protein|nr:Hsp20/alpha crystallin family protein [Planctomycetota bacterium]